MNHHDNSREISETPRGAVFLLGPLQVVSSDGKNCTPSGSVRKALMVALLLAPRYAMTRSSLHALLWPESTSHDAANSLREALCRLKRQLSPLGEDIVDTDTDRTIVRIRGDVLRIDLFDYVAPGGGDALLRLFGSELPLLLEGFDLKVATPDVFEEWLRLERSHWDTRLGNALEAAIAAPATRHGPVMSDKRIAEILDTAPRMPKHLELKPTGLGLMPLRVGPSAAHLGPLGQQLVTAVGAGLQDLCGAEIHDQRRGGDRAFSIPVGAAPRLLLTLHIEAQAGAARVMAVACDATSGQKVLEQSVGPASASDLKPDTLLMSGFVNQVVDRLADLLEADDPVPFRLSVSAHQALTLMFQLSDTALNDVEAMLSRNASGTNTPLSLALTSYLDTIRVGESWQRNELTRFDKVRDAAARVQEGAPGNGVALAAAGYALDYLAPSGTASGGDMLRRAVQVSPAQAFAWDHLAMHLFRQEDYKRAFAAACRAVRLGAFSPLRYVYETTACMSAAMIGDYHRAAHYGSRALCRQPGYSAALRYTAASLGHLGRRCEGQKLIERILARDPQFSVSKLIETGFLKAGTTARSQLADGLRKAGLN